MIYFFAKGRGIILRLDIELHMKKSLMILMGTIKILPPYPEYMTS